MRSEKTRELAAKLLKCGSNRVWFDTKEFDRIKSAMTKDDVRELIKDGIIKKAKANFHSRGPARLLQAKKARGRKHSFGSRRGTKKVRSEERKKWINRIRALRGELKKLRKENPKAVEKIGYRKLYKLARGNFFKGRRYMKEFVEGKTKA